MNTNSTPKTLHLPMHLVIFDTEFTAWPGSKERQWSEHWEHKEVIQLAAVNAQVSESGLAIKASFNELVKPSINPQLSDYICDLTGISQSMITEMGVDFPSAMEAFYQFCQQGQLPCFAWGYDANILRENCRLNQVGMPDFDSGFFNLHAIVRLAGLQEAHYSSGELAQKLSLPTEGHNHNALHDVRSVAMALDLWLKQGRMQLSQLQ